MNMNKIAIRFLIVCNSMFFSEQISFSQSPIPSGAVLEKVATGFQQPEGPVWKDGVGLLFSDIQRSTIYRWSQIDSITIYMHPSDSSNGLTFDRQGRLILTQMLSRRVARQELDGTIIPLTSTYNGKKYNSPNDVVVKSDGSIFFTDPDFNTPNGQAKELGFKGIFRISPYGVVYALDSTSFPKYPNQSEPNGICFSLDESKLYVNDSPYGKIYVWDIVNDSMILNKKLFYTIPLGGYADGMKVDPDGNLYCTGPKGVWVISKNGACLDTIITPVNPSNCAWGDADRKTLYITAGNSLYRIRMVVTGVEKDPEGRIPEKFELLQNYPNPFNPQTTIMYRIPKMSLISLKVFDVLGREVILLREQVVQAGTYSTSFDGTQHAAGIYFAQLTITPKFENISSMQTKKLLLIK